MKKILSSPNEYRGKSLSAGRFLIFLGFAFVFIFVLLKIISFLVNTDSTGFLKSLYDFSVSTATESVAALGLIILFFGFVFLYFNHQFSKLAKIADEVENNKDFCDEKE